MRPVGIGLTVAGLALGVFGCSLPVADKQSDAIAHAFYDEVRSGADLSRDAHVDALLESPESAGALARFRAGIPAGAPTSFRNAGWNYSSKGGEGSVGQLRHEYHYGDKTISVLTVLRKPEGGSAWTIVGFRGEASDSPSVVTVGYIPPADTVDN